MFTHVIIINNLHTCTYLYNNRKKTQPQWLMHNTKQVQKSPVLSTNDCFRQGTSSFGVDEETMYKI